MASRDSVVVRRPLLHIIVLFASDLRVLNYAKNVALKFLHSGIDVFFNVDLAEIGLGDTTVHAPQQIKPEHLSAVIAASHCDYIIVIGDRNMKNDTVQGRKAGKLVELMLPDRITSLLEAWGIISGLKGADASKLQHVDLDEKAVDTMNEETLMFHLGRFSPLPHPKERMQRIESSVSEIAELADKSRTLSGEFAADALTDMDQSLVTNLTRTQTALIRLHRDLADAQAAVDRYPVTQVSAPSDRSYSVVAGTPLDFGLGPGVFCSPQYKPNVAGGGYESTGNVPKRDGFAGVLSASLRNKLLDLSGKYLKQLRTLGDKLTAVVGEKPLGMWHAYLKEYAEKLAASQPPPPPPMPEPEMMHAGYLRHDELDAQARHAERFREYPRRHIESHDYPRRGHPRAPYAPSRPPAPYAPDGRSWLCGVCHNANPMGMGACRVCNTSASGFDDRAAPPYMAEYGPRHQARPWHGHPRGDRRFARPEHVWDPRMPRGPPRGAPRGFAREHWQHEPVHAPSYPAHPRFGPGPGAPMAPMPSGDGMRPLPPADAIALDQHFGLQGLPSDFDAPSFMGGHGGVALGMRDVETKSIDKPHESLGMFNMGSMMSGLGDVLPYTPTSAGLGMEPVAGHSSFLQSLRKGPAPEASFPASTVAPSFPVSTVTHGFPVPTASQAPTMQMWWPSSSGSDLTPYVPDFVPGASAPLPRLPPPSTDKPCQVCGMEGAFNCNMCASEPPYVPTYYCSAAHQSQHFKEHIKYHEDCRRKFGMPLTE